MQTDAAKIVAVRQLVSLRGHRCLASGYGTTQRTRREFPLHRKFRPAPACLFDPRVGHVIDARRLHLRSASRRPGHQDRRHPRVPGKVGRQPAQSGLSGVGRRRRVRPRPSSAPHRTARTGRTPGAGGGLRAHRIDATGSRQAAVGDVGDRRYRRHRPARRRTVGGDDQGPSRRGGRGERRQPVVAAVQRRTRHAAAGTGGGSG